MNKFEAIVFDMDGLMVDSEPVSRRAWETTLSAFGHQLTDDVYRQIIGRRIDQSAQILLQAYPTPISAETLATTKTAHYHALRAQGIPAMPGLTALQTAIKARGIPWAVATSSPREHAIAILAQLNLTGDCRAIASGDEVKHGKPNPEIYLLAAHRLGIAPDKCVALEDSEPGCQAATAAGMKTLVIPNKDTASSTFDCAYARYASLQHIADNLDTILSASQNV